MGNSREIGVEETTTKRWDLVPALSKRTVRDKTGRIEKGVGSIGKVAR